ncbi:MAG TPA: hypothetical protein VME47_12580 [Acetobacteraceae bacterium]|nr:hypothetical protein [Acetobacteraceae bacterium]
MKKGEKPEFSVSWWKGSQPKNLKSAGGLESALKSYESARGKLESSGSGDDAEAAEKALDGVEKAAKAATAEASKASKAKGDDMELTADCLKKFDYDKEHRWIDEHVEEGMFSDPDVYKKYLLTACKRLNSRGEMNFAFVLGKKAEQHRMALHPSKSGKALAGMLTKETGIHMFTFGVARSPESVGTDASEDPNGATSETEEEVGNKTMVLALEGKQIAGMAKKGARMLKKFKPLPFSKITLMVDGKEVRDLDDPEDTDSDDAEALDPAALTRALAELARRIPGVADLALKASLARMATQANALLRANSLADAEQRINELRTALDQAGAPANGGNGGAQETGSTVPAAVTKARQAWIATRGRVGDELEKLLTAIVTTYQSDGIAADLETRYRNRVSGVLNTLDESLSEKLNEVAGTIDATRRTTLAGEAKTIMDRYQSYVDGEALLVDLDDNPFVPLHIRQTVTATLAAVAKVVH